MIAPGRAQNDEKGITGRHVLYGLIGFFAVVFAVNGYFLYAALSTYTGVVSAEPYRKGLHYNERIAADERQHARGWRDKLALTPTADAITVELEDSEGRAISGLRIEGLIGRPSTTEHDMMLRMQETTPGRYEASFNKLNAGTWLVALEASERAGADVESVVYRLRKRLWLKP